MAVAIDRLSLAVEGLRARWRGLRVVVEKRPTDGFSDALDHLVPPGDEVGRFVNAALAMETRTPKRNVIVLHRGEPVFATTLRARQDRWETATAAVAPTLRIPHRDGFLDPAFSALGFRVLIQDYFGDALVDFKRQKLKPFTSYVAELDDLECAFEEYWRSTKIWDTIRRVERKTADMLVVHDDPATLSWSIDTWESRWAGDSSDEAGAADDMRAVWPRLLDEGPLRTTALVSSDGNPIASNVNFVEGDTLIGLISARDTSLPNSQGSVGTRVEIECWKAAHLAGLARVDIGGYHDYKRRLTPNSRIAHEVEIAPRLVAPETIVRARRIAGRAKRGLESVVRPATRR